MKKNVKVSRLRRARRTRMRITLLRVCRLSVHRSNKNIYAQVFDEANQKVLATASTIMKGIGITNGSNIEAAKVIGEHIAKKALSIGIKRVAFDRSGFAYHGRVKALADSARENGLLF